VAIVHYWLVGMRGGEKVVEALCRMFPQADIFTHVYVPERVSETIRAHKVTTSFIAALPGAARRHRRYLPLMPLALEQLDLRGYDLILSSESGPAKGVIPPPDCAHLCYCHSPMRYLWNMFHDYRDASGPLTRLLMPPLAHYLRNWDALSATRVDRYVANSRNVASRIRRYYHRDADVVFPPVDVDAFEVARDVGDHYLMVGELTPYKRPDLAVEAFNRIGRRLVVIGGGEMLPEIRKMAGPGIEVMGPQPFETLRHHYARARALVFPGEEDFGIVPVEAMASGRPVLAYRRGGAIETVAEGVSGVFFDEQTVESIAAGVAEIERRRFDPQRIVEHAAQFSPQRFERALGAVIAQMTGETVRLAAE
jgi:glycosyltransferase involved in cell wall biosynthesis